MQMCIAKLYYGKHVLDYRSTVDIGGSCSVGLSKFTHAFHVFRELGPQDLSSVPLNICNNKIISTHTHT